MLNRHVILTSSNKPWQHFANEIYNKYVYVKQYINRFVKYEEKIQKLLNAIYENKFKELAAKIIEEAKSCINLKNNVNFANILAKSTKMIVKLS